MTKTTKIILAVLVVTVIAIGIGYANLSNTVLNITGTIDAAAAQTDFKLEFQSDGVVKSKPDYDDLSVITTKTSATNATFSVSGLQVEGDTVTAEYTIVNNSNGIATTNISVNSTGNSESQYIETTIGMPSKTTLQPTETATVLVTTRLIKTPVGSQTQTVGLQITAEPEEATN